MWTIWRYYRESLQNDEDTSSGNSECPKDKAYLRTICTEVDDFSINWYENNAICMAEKSKDLK